MRNVCTYYVQDLFYPPETYSTQSLNSNYFMLIMTGLNMYLINLYLLLLHNLRITENYKLIHFGEGPIAVYQEEEEGYSDAKISNTYIK